MTAYTDFHYSPTGSGVISGAQVLEQTEQGINGLGQYVQDNVSGAIDTANQALTTAKSADSNATTAINLANSLNAQIIAANQTAGNALTTAQSAQNTANSASSLATTANNSAATALNTANSASAGVTALTGTVNSLGNRMTAAENNISTNAGNITTLQNNLATTNANVTAAANAASSAQATATSAQSTATLARNQAYVLRYTGTTITGGGTIAYADIDNTDNIKAGDKIIDISGAIYAIASVDTTNQTVTVGASPVINLFCDAENLIPAANDAYDLGSASKQWLNTYSKGYYYNGVAWGLDRANIWSADQTISNNNVTLILKNPQMTIGVTPSSTLSSTISFQDVNNSSLGGIQLKANQNSNNALSLLIRNMNGTDSYNCALRFRITKYGNAMLYSENAPCDLGSTTLQFKTLNGVNPGALSLPNLSITRTDISSSFLYFGNNVTNNYNVTADGYIFLRLDNTNQVTCYDVNASSVTQYAQTYKRDSDGLLYITFPVLKNTVFRTIWYTNSTVSVQSAYFIPCQGNV